MAELQDLSVIPFLVGLGVGIRNANMGQKAQELMAVSPTGTGVISGDQFGRRSVRDAQDFFNKIMTRDMAGRDAEKALAILLRAKPAMGGNQAILAIAEAITSPKKGGVIKDSKDLLLRLINDSSSGSVAAELEALSKRSADIADDVRLRLNVMSNSNNTSRDKLRVMDAVQGTWRKRSMFRRHLGEVMKLPGVPGLENLLRSFGDNRSIGELLDEGLIYKIRSPNAKTKGVVEGVYAKVRIGSTSFSFPLNQATDLVGIEGLGPQPIFHANEAGTTLAAFNQNIVSIDPESKMIYKRNPMEALFWGKGNTTPVIQDVIRESSRTGRSVQEILFGGKGSNIGKFGRYIEPDENAFLALLRARTQASILNFDEIEKYVERTRKEPGGDRGYNMARFFSDLEEVAHQKQGAAPGFVIKTWGSPGQIAKGNGFHIIHTNSAFKQIKSNRSINVQNLVQDLYVDPENMASGRRPLQPFADVYRKDGPIPSGPRNTFGNLPLFDQRHSPLLRRNRMTEELDQAGLGGHVQRTMYLKEGAMDEIGLKEGQAFLKENKEITLDDGTKKRIRNKSFDTRKTSRKVKITTNIADTGKALVHESLEPVLELLRDPKTALLTDEQRRSAIADIFYQRRELEIEKFKKEAKGKNLSPIEFADGLRDINAKHRRIFSGGMVLGQVVDPARGVVESRLNIGGNGVIRLTDATIRNGEVSLTFSRFGKVKEGDKVFGDAKATLQPLSGEEFQRRAMDIDPNFGRLSAHHDVIASASELVKPGNEFRLRIQQLTAARQWAATSRARQVSLSNTTIEEAEELLRESGIFAGKNGTEDEAYEFLATNERYRKRAKRFFDKARSLKGVDFMEAHALDEEAFHRQASVLFGMIEDVQAFEVQGKANLGTIFGLETEGNGILKKIFADSDLTALFTEHIASKDSQFVQNLKEGIEASRGVIGIGTFHMRKSVGEMVNSRPKIEARGLQNAFRMTDDIRVGDVTLRSLLLDDIVAGMAMPDIQKVQAAQSIVKNYSQWDKLAVEKASSSNLIHERMKMAYEDFGGAFDIGDELVAELKQRTDSKFHRKIDSLRRVFIPGSSLAEQMSPPLLIGEEIHKGGMSKATENLIDAMKGYELSSGDREKSIARISFALDEFDVAQKQVLGVTESILSGSMRHSRYEVISADTVQVTPDKKNLFRHVINNEDFYSTTKHLNTTMVSKRVMKETISAFSSIPEAERKALGIADFFDWLKVNKDSILKGDLSVPAFFQRNPTINEFGNFFGGMRVDPSLPANDVILRRPKLFKADSSGGLIDVSLDIAAASSSDADGDAWSRRLALSSSWEDAVAIVNSSTPDHDAFMKAYVAKSADYIHQTSVADEMLSQRVRDFFGAPVISGYSKETQAFISTYGQKEIGLVSNSIKMLKRALYVGTSEGLGTDAITDADMSKIDSMLYSLEQKAVGFKHIAGQSPAMRIVEGIADILGQERPEEMRLEFEKFMKNWFGDAIDNTSGPLYLSRESRIAIEHAMAASLDPEVKSVFRTIKTKTKDLMNVPMDQLINAIENSSGVANELDEVLAIVKSVLSTGSKSNLAGDQIASINENILRQGTYGVRKELTKASVMKPIMLGALAGAVMYSMFDSGYSTSPLEAPRRPDGSPGTATSIGMRMAIGNGHLLNDSHNPIGFDYQEPNSQVALETEPRNMPRIPGTTPSRSMVDTSSARMSFSGVVPESMNPKEIASTLGVILPYNQVGVNIRNVHSYPRNMEDYL